MYSATSPMPPEARIFIAGHRGLVGSALWRHFTAHGYQNLIGCTSTELDLRDARATAAFFEEMRPDVVIAAAARVGGIAANASRPAEFISDNLRIQINLFDSAVANGVERFLFLGSSCVYPKLVQQPIREDALFTGRLEETNESYAVAKLAGIAHLVAIRREHGLPYICAMPTNLYGPGDNFNPHDSHVIPAMIRRFHDAVRDGATAGDLLGNWTTPAGVHARRRPGRCVPLLAGPLRRRTTDQRRDRTSISRSRNWRNPSAKVVGYQGEICWDATKPDGTPRKLLDVQRLTRTRMARQDLTH